MTKSFLMFPTGPAGAGLLLLRLALAAVLVFSLAMFDADLSKAALLAVALALLAGVGTRLIAVAVACLTAYAALRLGAVGGAFVGLHGVSAVALAMLGPGGYSLDAHRFGRRVIDLDR